MCSGCGSSPPAGKREGGCAGSRQCWQEGGSTPLHLPFPPTQAGTGSMPAGAHYGMQVLPVLLVIAAAGMEVDKSGSQNFRESWCGAQVLWQSWGAHGPKGAVVRRDGMEHGCSAECPALTLPVFVPSRRLHAFCVGVGKSL